MLNGKQVVFASTLGALQLLERYLAPHWPVRLIRPRALCKCTVSCQVMHKYERARVRCPQWFAHIVSMFSISLVQVGPPSCMAKNTAHTIYIYMSYYLYRTYKGSRIVYYIVPKNGTPP